MNRTEKNDTQMTIYESKKRILAGNLRKAAYIIWKWGGAWKEIIKITNLYPLKWTDFPVSVICRISTLFISRLNNPTRWFGWWHLPIANPRGHPRLLGVVVAVAKRDDSDPKRHWSAVDMDRPSSLLGPLGEAREEAKSPERGVLPGSTCPYGTIRRKPALWIPPTPARSLWRWVPRSPPVEMKIRSDSALAEAAVSDNQAGERWPLRQRRWATTRRGRGHCGSGGKRWPGRGGVALQ
jgi:hypothetical protein